MAIAFRASVSNEQTASGTDVQVTIPATVQTGDAMVAVWTAASTTATVTTPAGWTLEAGPVDKSTVIREYVFSRIAQAGDAGSTFTITKSVSDATKRYITLVAYSGTHATTPVQAITSAVETVSGTSHTGAAATATGTGCWLLQHASDRGSPASTDITPPGGLTERVEQVGTGSGTMTVEMSDSNGTVSAGSVGAVAWSGTVSTANAITWTIVLQPPAGGTNATATPSVVSGSVSFAGLAGQTGSTVTPDLLAGAVSFSAPTVVAPATALTIPDLIETAVSFFAPSILSGGDSTVQPPPFVLTVNFPTPGVTFEEIHYFFVTDFGGTQTPPDPTVPRPIAAMNRANVGSTVLRVNGVWETLVFPSEELVNAADRVYRGGYIHSITQEEADELIAAGFGAHVFTEFPT